MLYSDTYKGLCKYNHIIWNPLASLCSNIPCIATKRCTNNSVQEPSLRNHLLMPMFSIVIPSLCFHSIFCIPWLQYFSIFNWNSLSSKLHYNPSSISMSTFLVECLPRIRNSHEYALHKTRNYRLTPIYKYFTLVSFHLRSGNCFTHWKYIILTSILYSTIIYNNNSSHLSTVCSVTGTVVITSHGLIHLIITHT